MGVRPGGKTRFCISVSPMAKATIKHTRVRRDRHPNTQKSKRDSSAAPADHVLVLAEAIDAKEREQECASLKDKKLGRLLDDELGELDDRLALAVPSSWAGAAFKLRKGVHFSENHPIAEPIREIADRVSRGRIEFEDLSYLRSAAAYLSQQENDAAPPFFTTALQWLARPKLVGCTARRERGVFPARACAADPRRHATMKCKAAESSTSAASRSPFQSSLYTAAPSRLVCSPDIMKHKQYRYCSLMGVNMFPLAGPRSALRSSGKVSCEESDYHRQARRKHE